MFYCFAFGFPIAFFETALCCKTAGNRLTVLHGFNYFLRNLMSHKSQCTSPKKSNVQLGLPQWTAPKRASCLWINALFRGALPPKTPPPARIQERLLNQENLWTSRLILLLIRDGEWIDPWFFMVSLNFVFWGWRTKRILLHCKVSSTRCSIV